MKRLLLYLSLVLSLLVSLTALAAPAYAQDRSVVVERRDADVTILPSGDVRVVETWEVHFIGGPFRFAFRSIPLDRVDSITNWGVGASGQSYTESFGEQPGTFRL